VAAALLDGFDG